MRVWISVLLWAWVCSTVQAQPEMPTPVFKPGSVILFQGDSITHGGRGSDMNHYLGHGYQAVIAHRYLAYLPEAGYQFLNRAVSGETTERLLARWDRDGLAPTVTERGYAGVFGLSGSDGTIVLKPDVLSLLIGVNDDSHATCTPEAYRDRLRELLKRSREANPQLKMVLGEPFRPPEELFNTVRFAQIQSAAAEVAAEFGIPLVKYQKLFNETLPKIRADSKYWIWDACHPTYAAHQRMADEWMRTVRAWTEAPVTNTALIPRGKLQNDSYDFFARHVKIRNLQRQIDPEVVLIGDSITHFWCGREACGEPGEGSEHWKKAFAGYRVLNMGFGWDRTQNVLWRLDHGELDGCKPKLVVIHIGTNNIGGTPEMRANTPEEIAEGILAICGRVWEKVPGTRIVLMAIFPRQERSTDFWRVQARAANTLLKARTEGMENLTFLDIGDRLVNPDGTLSRSIMGDFCHPTPAGYAIWADALRPYLETYCRPHPLQP